MTPLLIPVVSKLAQSGLSLLADAVTAKGKDYIEDKLGVDLTDSVKTEQGLIQLKQLELDNQKILLEYATKQVELSNQNTSSARDMNQGIQESSNASALAKNAAYILDFIIVIATLVMAYTILFQVVPESNKEIFYMAFGSLLSMCVTVLNFHRGSSQVSKSKDEAHQATIQMLGKK
jgi:hypothetical protein